MTKIIIESDGIEYLRGYIEDRVKSEGQRVYDVLYGGNVVRIYEGTSLNIESCFITALKREFGELEREVD